MPPEQSRSIMRDKTEWNISVHADSATPKGKKYLNFIKNNSEIHTENLYTQLHTTLSTCSCFTIKKNMKL
jgi:hypothetical protein